MQRPFFDTKFGDFYTCNCHLDMIHCPSKKNKCLFFADTHYFTSTWRYIMKVSVLGFGTVGEGVYRMLESSPGFLPGPVLELPSKATESFMVDNLDTIISDPTIEAVVETMGGVHPAYEFACKVMEAGKHFVTSNKALIAEKGPDLASLAANKGVGFMFSAACGGAIPYLANLKTAVSSGETIQSLSGLLNGTTNYILDRMQTSGISFEAALAEAKNLGYAEADPSADLSGLDTLRKIMLACAVSYNMLPVDGMEREGIENFTAEDAKHINSLGYVCRLKTKAKYVDSNLRAYVEPTLCAYGSPESTVTLNGNMARYIGMYSNTITLFGQGAGRYPTASAVMRDLISIKNGAENMLGEACKRVSADNSDSMHVYYLRMPAEYADELLSEVYTQENGIVRGITEKISVKDMHGIVSEIRANGDKVFFAAVERKK